MILLPDFSSMINTMKKASLNANEAGKPVNIVFGKVVSVKPLRISVEQKLTLEASQLVLAQSVTEHQVDITVDHWTEAETAHFHAVQDTYTGSGTSSPTTHKHEYKGRKTITVHRGLTLGDEVIMVRMQNGQKYAVIDRLGVTT
jgi:hypothetical protein